MQSGYSPHAGRTHTALIFKATGLLLLLFAMAVVAFLTTTFVAHLRDNHWYMRAPPQVSRQNNAERDALAIVGDLLRVERSANALKIVTPGCEQRLNQSVDAEVDKQLKILCDTDAGRQLLEEIDAANSVSQTLAVRDDRRSPEVPTYQTAARTTELDEQNRSKILCDDRTRPGVVITRKCFENSRSGQWRGVMIQGEGRLPVDLSADEPRVDRFRRLAGRIIWPGDWAAIAQSALPHDLDFAQADFILSTKVSSADLAGLTVQLVGNPVGIGVNGKWRTIDTPFARPATPRGRPKPRPPFGVSFNLDGIEVSVMEFCSIPPPGDPKLVKYATDAPVGSCRLDQSRGYEIFLSGVKRDDVQFEIKSRFQAAPLPRNKAAVLLSGNLEVRCANKGELPDCRGAGDNKASRYELGWKERKNPLNYNRDARYDIVDRSGASLLQDSQTIVDVGLAPVIGLVDTEGETLSTIANRMSRRQTPGSARFSMKTTFDLRMQRIANESLVRMVRDRDARSKPSNADDNAATPERRATIVLMDAGETSGEILAMASTPAVRAGYHIWDVDAMLDGPPNGNPFAGHAWRAADRETMPGSTFKVVTALSAIDRVLRHPDSTLEAILKGAPAALAKRTFRVFDEEPGNKGSADVTGVPSYSGVARCGPGDLGCFFIHNASGEKRFEHKLDSKELMAACDHTAIGTMGLCEALAISSNLYFVGLARYVDEGVIAPDGAHEQVPPPRLSLESIGERLFPMTAGATKTLFRNAEGYPDCEPPGRFCAEAMDLRDNMYKGGWRLRLAQAGFGQGFHATPVGVATIYASLAAGRVIEPTLIAGLAPQPRKALIEVPGREQDAAAYLEVLRRGLRAVGRGVGTIQPRHMPHMKGQFADGDNPRLYMKTGTAQVHSKSKFRPGEPVAYTGWLAGWLEPRAASTDRSIRSRLAFACMVTGGTKDQYGATLCGSLVDEILCRIESADADQMKCAGQNNVRPTRPKKKHK
jgi:cell division protein FtsI/penicillin-binding protein 2